MVTQRFPMPGCLFRSWILLVSGLFAPATAQQPLDPWQMTVPNNPIVQQFNSFLNEPEAERNRIESVEVDFNEERRIGEADLATYLSTLKTRGIRVVERGRDFEYVSSLVDLIRPRMKRTDRYPKFRVVIAETKATDARAFPGGSIIIMTGLIELAESEAALVCILGHELSHIDHGHQLRRARAMQLASREWQSGKFNPHDLQGNLQLMARNVARPYHADDEAVADVDGATWAFELGYQPLELAKLFERLAARQGQTQARNRASLPSFLLSHPSYANRLETIRERSAHLQRNTPAAKLYVGRENLTKRVPRRERKFPE
jgi:Zn-dependent protease with chaperone function